MRRILQILLLFVLCYNYSCVPPEDEILTEINLDLNDKQLQKIYTFQDQAQVDSLLALFEHPDPTYRYSAAMAMASIRDAKTMKNLAGLLTDRVQKVRTAAAYAIGQMGVPEGEQFLIDGFDSADTLGLYKASNGAILEAIGRCGNEQSLQFLSTIQTYTAQDTALLEGQAWGIYRFATRKMAIPEGTNRMVEFVKNTSFPNSARFVAANYLYRAKNISLDSVQVQTLAQLLEKEEDPRIRMTTAIALGKSKQAAALKALTSQFAKEQDYRVKCNILRALGNFPYAEMQGLFFELIANSNKTLAKCASSFFVEHGESRDARVYWRKARDLGNFETKLNMLKAANRHMPAVYEEYKWLINNDLKLIYQDTTNLVYHRAEALRGLAEFSWNYKYLNDQIITSKNPILRTAAMEGIASIISNPKFDANFGVSRTRVKTEIVAMLSNYMELGDAGVMAIAAGVLANPKLNLKEAYTNSSFLFLAKRSLALPQETETLYAIEKAIAYFDDKEYEPKQPKFNHPFEWKQLEGVTTNSKAIVETSKGNFTLQFYPLDAPASVANFIKLSQQGFYNDKTFHRVVPNFVIQVGCPRGDGYGSLDYTIRSEVPLRHYDDGGYVGMASAGKNTEGTQWFVTHSPTPHLDGNYTIFAKVVEGMDVVHKIQVGDTIESVKLLL